MGWNIIQKHIYSVKVPILQCISCGILGSQTRLFPHVLYWQPEGLMPHAGQHDVTSYLILHFFLGISSFHQALWVWSKPFLEWQENIWSENCQGQHELSDHTLHCFDIYQHYYGLLMHRPFGFSETVNELVSIQFKTSEANKLLVISIIILTFVDLELEGKNWLSQDPTFSKSSSSLPVKDVSHSLRVKLCYIHNFASSIKKCISMHTFTIQLWTNWNYMYAINS